MSEIQTQNLIQQLNTTVAKASLIERHDNYCRFKISSDGLLLSDLFGKIEENKETLRIKEYSFAQTSLEQVILINISRFLILLLHSRKKRLEQSEELKSNYRYSVFCFM